MVSGLSRKAKYFLLVMLACFCGHAFAQSIINNKTVARVRSTEAVSVVSAPIEIGTERCNTHISSISQIEKTIVISIARAENCVFTEVEITVGGDVLKLAGLGDGFVEMRKIFDLDRAKYKWRDGVVSSEMYFIGKRVYAQQELSSIKMREPACGTSYCLRSITEDERVMLAGIRSEKERIEASRRRAKEECKILDADTNDTYDGECKDGYAHGKGKARGHGKYYVYEGDFFRGRKHGFGVGEYSCRCGLLSCSTCSDKGVWENGSFISSANSIQEYSARVAREAAEEKVFRSVLNQKNPQLMYTAAMKYESSGDLYRARLIYERLIERFPSSQWAAKAKAKDQRASQTASPGYRSTNTSRDYSYRVIDELGGAKTIKCNGNDRATSVTLKYDDAYPGKPYYPSVYDIDRYSSFDEAARRACQLESN